MTGTAMAQAIPIAASPILTRLYTPEDFGLLALFLATFSILSTIVTGKYELAIMAPATVSESQTVVFLSLLIAVVIFIITIIPAILFSQEIAAFLGNPDIAPWLGFVPITVLCLGVYQSIDYWLNRQKNYKQMAINKLGKAGSISLLQLVMGFLGGVGLIIGHIVGWILAILVIFAKTRLSFREFDFKSVKAMALEYKSYPILQAPSSLLAAVSVQAPIFIMTRYFEETMVGFFSLVIRILSAPAALIAKSTGQVFFERVSHHASHAPELLIRDLYQVSSKLAIISLAVFTPVLFFGREIFAIVFGAEWAEAGSYAQVLVFAIAIQFVVSPLSTILLAIGKIKVSSFWQLVYFVVTFMTLFIAAGYDPQVFIWVYVVKDLVLYGFYYLLMVYSVKSFAADKARI